MRPPRDRIADVWLIVSGRERNSPRFTTLCYASGVTLFDAGRFAAGEPLTDATLERRCLRYAGTLN